MKYVDNNVENLFCLENIYCIACSCLSPILCARLCMVCLISDISIERRNASQVEAVSATCFAVGLL